MKASTTARFILALPFATLACVAMFFQLGAVGLLSGIAWLLLVGFQELVRPIPRSEVWPTLIVVGAFLAAGLTFPFLHLRATAPNAVLRGILSVALWLFWLWVIHQRWQKERGIRA